MIGVAVALYVARDEIRRQRRERRAERFNRYLERLHSREASTEATIAHFWLGSMYAKYGPDEKLDDWMRLTHGCPPKPIPDDFNAQRRRLYE